MAEFKGFGYTSPEEITARTMAGFQQAMASGNVNAMRMAVAQMGAFGMAGSPELRKAKERQEVINQAQEESLKAEPEDEIAQEMAFYRRAQQLAVEADLPDIALQATERLSNLRITQDERNRLRRVEEREEKEFTQEQEDREVELAEKRLARRQNLASAGANAYRESINNGDDELTAKQKARKAQLVYLSAETEEGHIGAGTRLAAERGIDLSVDTFDIGEAEAISADNTPQLKSLTTVINEKGEPEIAFTVQTPDGPKLIRSGEVDAGALAAMSSESSGGKITDSQRKNAAFAFNMSQSVGVVDQLSFTGEDFTGVGDTLEGMYPNRLTSADRQKFEQAKETFINAKLRRESGATIKDEEYFRAEKAMFPQPGDTPQVVAQKRRMRLAEFAGVYAAAGDVAYSAVVETYNRAIQSSNAAELEARGY